MKNYLKFKDNRRSDTDDYLFKIAAIESMFSTMGGLGVTILGMLIPVFIAFADVPVQVKVGAFGSGGVGSFAGCLISRFKPNFPRSDSQDSSVIKEEF